MRITLLVAAIVVSCVACTGSKQKTSNAQMTDEQYGDAMATEHAADEDQPSGAAGQAAGQYETTGTMVKYGEFAEEEFVGFLATPAKGDASAAVIVIHEWWGLNENVKEMATKLASHGYTVLAVDMYGGKSASKPEEAKKLMMHAMESPDAAVVNLEAARAFLAEKATKIGVLGWCFGGGWSLEAGISQGERISAVVMYYGRVKGTKEEVASLEAPLLGIFGALDKGIPVDQVRRFDAALQAAGKDAQIHVYDGADHAFANPSGGRYAKDAAEDAWGKTLAFFEKHLAP